MKTLRVILGVIGYFIIAGVIGDMDVTNTMTSIHMAYIAIGMILVIQSIVMVRR